MKDIIVGCVPMLPCTMIAVWLLLGSDPKLGAYFIAGGAVVNMSYVVVEIILWLKNKNGKRQGHAPTGGRDQKQRIEYS